MRQPKSTLIPIESCQSSINYIGRLPVDEICSNMSIEQSDYLIGATCPFAIASPTSKTLINRHADLLSNLGPHMNRSLAFQCCRESLSKKSKELKCTEQIDDTSQRFVL